jgi:hypothetical protein
MERNRYFNNVAMLKTKSIATIMGALGFIASSAMVAPCGASGLLDESVTAGGVKVTINVVQPTRNEYLIEAKFESSSYPVGCLSAYRDLHYELLDSHNHVIPIDAATVAHPPYEGQVNNHVTSDMVGKPPRPCAENAPGGIWPARAILSDLYPQLAPGDYMLHVSFAPHGSAQLAEFHPVRIEIVPAP